LAQLAYLGMASDFNELRVYRLAAELADEIYESVGHWPLQARKTFGDQLIRSVDSIGANIAEATGRRGTADKRRLLFIARGSLHEAEHWIKRGESRGVLPHGTSTRLQVIASLLNGLIRRPSKGTADGQRPTAHEK
jgi:four helix bundle protein